MAYDTQVHQLIEDFELLEDWEDRYRYVIELGKSMKPLDADERNDTNKVRGCVSQVWLVSNKTDNQLHFRGESDALIVQGLIAILMKIFDGKRPDEILDTDAESLFHTLGFDDHLTPQRSNGLASMVQRIKSDARTAAA